MRWLILALALGGCAAPVSPVYLCLPAMTPMGMAGICYPQAPEDMPPAPLVSDERT